MSGSIVFIFNSPPFLICVSRVITRPVTRGGESPLEKCVGHNLKLLETGQKFEPLLENSSPLLVSQAGYGPGYNLI